MAIVTMSLTQALVRKKTLESQIRNLTSDVQSETVFSNRSKISNLLCDYIIGNFDKCSCTNETIEERKVSVKAYKDKIMSLIDNYEALCLAINKANATTKLVIGNKEMTIAEAIALKKNPILDLKMAFSLKLYMDWDFINNKINSYNNSNCNNESINDYITTILGDKVDRTSEEAIKLEQKFHEQRDAVMVDSLNANSLAASLKEEVDNFRDEVDYKLSEINSKTEITVEFVD